MTNNFNYNFEKHYSLIHIGFQIGRLEFLYNNQSFDFDTNVLIQKSSKQTIDDINSYLKPLELKVNESLEDFKDLLDDLIAKIQNKDLEYLSFLRLGMGLSRFMLAKAKNPISEELLALSKNSINNIPSKFLVDKDDFFNYMIENNIDSPEKMDSYLKKIVTKSSHSKIGTIRVFLASSSELVEDRKSIREFLSIENDRLHKKGIYFELIQWEFASASVSESNKQEDYNKQLRESDIALCLFATKTGKYIEEEFEVALNQFRSTGKPLIFTYFKNESMKMNDLGMEFISLLKFKEKLKNLGHFPNVYENIDDLKYQFKIQLEKIYGLQ